ncbi:hypothetical protein K469DRAFT_271519 [Zopfia rhizophila CBS 207.26]|uniref:Uncharacterized protein n=1 Tax=Zopfia rhizophila CBS 207.26 TaxID=1314779 RepID=A0A6A6DT43_9PEZI|nr:hypothetical protein K469DRAFT_271519 [Zopfia rhizophila CBS 207.26]
MLKRQKYSREWVIYTIIMKAWKLGLQKSSNSFEVSESLPAWLRNVKHLQCLLTGDQKRLIRVGLILGGIAGILGDRWVLYFETGKRVLITAGN